MNGRDGDAKPVRSSALKLPPSPHRYQQLPVGPVVRIPAGSPPDARPGMDVDAGTRVGVLAHDASDDRHALRMEDVRHSNPPQSASADESASIIQVLENEYDEVTSEDPAPPRPS